MKHYLLLGLCLVFLGSCKKPEVVSTIPAITFKSITPYRTNNIIDSLKIVISFTDGDGDIGFRKGDTIGNFSPHGAYYNNLYVTPYEEKNGIFLEQALRFSNNYRTPYLTPDGRNKTLKGDIAVMLTAFEDSVRNDTLKYHIQLLDRALNRSNTVETPQIIISTY